MFSRLLTNDNNKLILFKIIQEISLTFGLSLFLLYLFYQLLGNFLLIIFIVCGVLFTLYGLQDALLYQPNEPDTARTIVLTPDLFQMPYETITIETSDNEKLHGYLIKQNHHSNECETLIFFHGNAGNIGHRLQNVHLLYQACNINVLLFDYRGYGKSTGKPSEAGFYIDAQAVYDYVRKRTDLNQEKIFFFGRSLGGAVALHLASHLAETNETLPLYCVIVENTFTSIPDMAKRLFQVFIIDYIPTWCYKNVFSSIKKIRHIKVPVLFLSGAQDELVPPQMMQKLHEECTSPKKQLILFSDGQHNTTWLSYNYTTQIYKFLHECSISLETTPTASSVN
ncbi:unnamed protein product [Rotaria sordida]|nr:unnamed protein product [Rotaria sordida]CAF3585310.1 unnamed protein product [Rotaria sordida]CAF3849075.1 unnamed protein product [Rotaria sordida]CAF4049579.1 unnamed protein product [Rotaria sordida]